MRPNSIVSLFSLLCELIFSPASPLGLSTPAPPVAPPVVWSGLLMGGLGRHWSSGGSTCRPAVGDVPARCRFGDVTAYSRTRDECDGFGGRDRAWRSGAFGPFGILPSGKHGRARSARRVRRIGREAERHRGPTERLPDGEADSTPPCWGRQADGVGSSPLARGAGEMERMLLFRYGDTDPPSLTRPLLAH